MMDNELTFQFGTLAQKAKAALSPALQGFEIVDDKLLAYAAQHNPVAYGWFVRYRDTNGNCVILKICKDNGINLEGQNN